MSEQQRYRICSDNSGHEYFIKIQDVEAFYTWADVTEDWEHAHTYEGPNFDEFRIDGTFTFTDPRCE